MTIDEFEPPTLDEFDRITTRLRWAATVRGDSPTEVAELVSDRERERQRIVEAVFGPQGGLT